MNIKITYNENEFKEFCKKAKIQFKIIQEVEDYESAKTNPKTQQEINHECIDNVIKEFGCIPRLNELSGEDRKKFLDLISRMNEC